ncbi:Lysophospholipase L1 [Gracilimonas mengyeensis]|uniref:Lysophospholipase L1 n=2 Tax=Gracilimonas mengyeensis TaxID=1302730 RepID=A0A521AYB3_9BACT|nr:Lysophospholipase L1 [Gracilimonas mengyeensis]
MESSTAVVVLIGLMAMIGFSACTQTQQTGEEMEWLGAWSTAQQLVEPRNMPPEPGLSGNTIRQVIQVNMGGDTLRLSLSNAFGTKPVAIHSVHVAQSTDSSAIDAGTDLALSFDGESSVTIQPGERVFSEPFSFDLEALSRLSITMHVDSVSSDLTGHPGSRTTSYIVNGDAVSAENMPNAAQTNHWYLIDAIDVKAPEHFAAVAVLGNSITDGRGSGTNKQNRWPDELAKRLQANDSTDHISVLNQGIGGNCVLKACLGPAAVDRFERDVLDQPGVEWLIILEGINDIGGVRSEEHADQVVSDLKAAYKEMVEKAHQEDIKVYGATLMPFGESFYDRPESERARQEVNDWIRNSGVFDAVIDLDKALGDPENPTQLLPKGDTGDHLHPNETGHRLIAEAIDLSLFLEEE